MKTPSCFADGISYNMNKVGVVELIKNAITAKDYVVDTIIDIKLFDIWVTDNDSRLPS